MERTQEFFVRSVTAGVQARNHFHSVSYHTVLPTGVFETVVEIRVSSRPVEPLGQLMPPIKGVESGNLESFQELLRDCGKTITDFLKYLDSLEN